ncbi:major pollen allergen Ole e 6-like [Juglans microcarpa x Juglans regia]|uniref:major pollen allergen Ole e 6-like n=1 Tax=Juglans microcarpa x Juglans regia TaxID=2249226 RepID=UPI001B7F7411|nr:major pollen allergen Ole e 6-like [Juglans microcarpa x Juglans regia]
MANKFVAVFLMCIVVVAAFSLHHEVEAAVDSFKSCFDVCNTNCKNKGNGGSFCEIDCDNSCTAAENEEKLKATIY